MILHREKRPTRDVGQEAALRVAEMAVEVVGAPPASMLVDAMRINRRVVSSTIMCMLRVISTSAYMHA